MVSTSTSLNVYNLLMTTFIGCNVALWLLLNKAVRGNRKLAAQIHFGIYAWVFILLAPAIYFLLFVSGPFLSFSTNIKLWLIPGPALVWALLNRDNAVVLYRGAVGILMMPGGTPERMGQSGVVNFVARYLPFISPPFVHCDTYAKLEAAGLEAVKHRQKIDATQFQTGDLFYLCCTNELDAASVGLKFGHGCLFGHIGMVIVDPSEPDKPLLLDCIENDTTSFNPNVMHKFFPDADPNKQTGVVLRDLRKLMIEYEGNVFAVRKLRSDAEITPEQVHKSIMAFLSKAHHLRFVDITAIEGVWTLLQGALDVMLTLPFVGSVDIFGNDAADDATFCSQLIAAILQHAELLPSDSTAPPANEYTPGDFCSLADLRGFTPENNVAREMLSKYYEPTEVFLEKPHAVTEEEEAVLANIGGRGFRPKTVLSIPALLGLAPRPPRAERSAPEARPGPAPDMVPRSSIAAAVASAEEESAPAPPPSSEEAAAPSAPEPAPEPEPEPKADDADSEPAEEAAAPPPSPLVALAVMSPVTASPRPSPSLHFIRRLPAPPPLVLDEPVPSSLPVLPIEFGTPPRRRPRMSPQSEPARRLCVTVTGSPMEPPKRRLSPLDAGAGRRLSLHSPGSEREMWAARRQSAPHVAPTLAAPSTPNALDRPHSRRQRSMSLMLRGLRAM